MKCQELEDKIKEENLEGDSLHDTKKSKDVLLNKEKILNCFRIPSKYKENTKSKTHNMSSGLINSITASQIANNSFFIPTTTENEKSNNNIKKSTLNEEDIIKASIQENIIKENNFTLEDDNPINISYDKAKIKIALFNEIFGIKYTGEELTIFLQVDDNYCNWYLQNLYFYLFQSIPFVNLIELNLISCKINSFDSFIENCHYPNLKNLKLSKNLLTEFPKFTKKFSPILEMIDLGKNDIYSLDGIKEAFLPKLKSLYLDSNKILNIDGLAFSDLPSLTLLDLKSNELGENFIAIENVDNLPNLEVLIISKNNIGNNIIMIDPNLFPNLKVIRASYNQIHDFYSDKKESENPNKKKILFQNLTEIDLSSNYLSDFHTIEVYFGKELPSLEILNLNRNNFSNLENLKHLILPKLKTLNLNSNKIKSVKCLNQVTFPELKHFNLVHNDINNLEGLDQIKFPKLETLGLIFRDTDQGNTFTNIDIFTNINLPNLRVLYIPGRKIANINCLAKAFLPELVSINLSYNLIKDIDIFEIKENKFIFPKLGFLDIRNNKIKYYRNNYLIIKSLKERQVEVKYDGNNCCYNINTINSCFIF